MEFVYDSSGLCGFKYNREEYLYQKNIQGDIIAILNLDGEVIAEYRYDAWGNCEYDLASGIATANPFRYRGYYFDRSTGLYYLQTRYYDPETGRFISQDDVTYLDPEHINGLNLYAYCCNNPVMMTDPDGTLPKWLKWLLGGLVIIASVVLSVATAGIGAAITGALGGGLAASIVGGAVAGAVGGMISGFGFSLGTQIIENGFDIDWKQVGIDTLIGVVSGAIAGGIFGAVRFIQSAQKIAGTVLKIGNAKTKMFSTIINSSQKVGKYSVKNLITQSTQSIGVQIIRKFVLTNILVMKIFDAGHLIFKFGLNQAIKRS